MRALFVLLYLLLALLMIVSFITSANFVIQLISDMECQHIKATSEAATHQSIHPTLEWL